MTQERFGKLSAEELRSTVLSRLGAPDPEVLAGPAPGVDVGVLRVAPGVVMAVTTDPVFVMPELGWERAAWSPCTFSPPTRRPAACRCER